MSLLTKVPCVTTLHEIQDRMRPPLAAKYLGLSEQRLAKMRWAGEGPEYLKLGRSVIYDRRALDAFMQSSTRRSTSDQGPIAA